MSVNISKIICEHVKLVRDYNIPIWDKSSSPIWYLPLYLASYKVLTYICPNEEDYNASQQW